MPLPRNLADYPAFPCQTITDEGGTAYFAGMTLRQYYAGQAMLGLVSDPNVISEARDDLEEAKRIIAEGAVQMADALIARLENEES